MTVRKQIETQNLYTGSSDSLSFPLTRDLTHDLGDGRGETLLSQGFAKGAAVAYSLRALGSYNEPVVRVRREPHDEDAAINDEKNFTASQVSGGELENWVNGKLESTLPADVATAAGAYSLRRVSEGSLHYTSDFSSDTDTIIANTTNLTLTGNIDGISDGTTSKDNVLKVENDATRTPQLGITNADYVASSDGIVEFTYYVPTGHPIIGSFWHIGTGSGIPNNYYTDNGVKIVGGTWTTAKLFFGSTHNGVDKPTTSGTGGRRMLTIANNIKASSVTETVQADDGDIYYISALTFKETIDNAVRIRRSSDDVEVDVAFDSDNKVSASSAITNIAEEGGEIGSTTATDLNGLLNEVLTVGTAVNGTGSFPYDEFTANGNTGFDADNKGGGTSSAGLPYSFANGDVIVIRFTVSNFDSESGLSPSFRGTTSTGNVTGVTSGGSIFTANGTYTETHTATGDGSFFMCADGNTGSYTISDFQIVSHTHQAFVHTWYDQAGSNDAVQATDANQPKIAESGALLADGISFDGVNNFLDTDGVFTDNRSASIFTKVKALTSDAVGSAYFYTEGYSGENGSVSQTIGVGITETGNIADITASINITTNDGRASALANGGLISLIGGSSTTASNINGVQMGSITTPTNADGNYTITTSGGIGGHSSTSSLAKFSIEELILYTSDQTNNRFKIESNINNYYGLYNDANEVTGAFTSSGAESFTASGTDGFTLTNSTSTAFAGLELNQVLAAGEKIYISFNLSIDAGSNTSPNLNIRESSITGGTASDEGFFVPKEGFNSTVFTSDSGGDARYISFGENDTDPSIYTISDFKVSRIARNGLVQTWYDQSGNGNNASQSSASKQPFVVENGSQIKMQNGNGAVKGTRYDDNHIDLLELDNTIAEPTTIFSTYYSSRSFALLNTGNNTGGAPRIQLNTNGIKPQFSGADDMGTTSTDNTTDSLLTLFSAENGGTAVLRKDGTQIDTLTRTGVESRPIAFLFRHQSSVDKTGVFVDSFIVFNSDKTSDFVEIENELKRANNL